MPRFVRFRPRKVIRSAFTLIEVLVVLVIIGIVATLAIPNLQEARAEADATKIMADVHTIEIACTSYIDKGGTLEELLRERVVNNPAPPSLMPHLANVPLTKQSGTVRQPQQAPDGTWSMVAVPYEATHWDTAAGIRISISIQLPDKIHWLNVLGVSGVQPVVYLSGKTERSRAVLKTVYAQAQERGWPARYLESKYGYSLNLLFWGSKK